MAMTPNSSGKRQSLNELLTVNGHMISKLTLTLRISRLSARSSLEDQTSKPVNYATEL